MHILIIGGGLGGLISGALLAHKGHRITILEQNSSIGGGISSFMRHGLSFPTGMHIFGGFSDGALLDRLFRQLGIRDSIGIRQTDNDCIDEIRPFHTATPSADGITYRMPAGRKNYTDYLCSLFPDQTQGIVSYIDDIYSIAHAHFNSIPFQTPDPAALMPADQFIASHISDHRLQALLSYLAPLYAGISGKTPAYEHALINMLHIEGSSLFIEGPHTMANALAGIITASGGQIVTSAQVSSIDVEEHAVRAVHTADGGTYSADRYICAINPYTLTRLCTHGAFPPSFTKRLADAPYTYSAFKTHLLFKECAVRHVNHPVYYRKDPLASSFDAHLTPLPLWPSCFMTTTTEDTMHPGYAKSMTIVAPVSFEQFRQWENTLTGKRGEDYMEFKNSLRDRILALIEDVCPQSDIEYCDCSTPLTIRDWMGAPYGSMFGFQKDCNHIMYTQLSPSTKVRNLFLTGQYVNLHGMFGTAVTAIQTVSTILGEPLPQI